MNIAKFLRTPFLYNTSGAASVNAPLIEIEIFKMKLRLGKSSRVLQRVTFLVDFERHLSSN